ncbi:sensor histidine kinase [Sphingomonas sp. R-74633]|uniref:sensor histidine kinase n=1 Tax=Sphingomonas sp. R-74633 TaxID=2751188 RepID=UPI0015D0E81E|nr:sensor histidine kinase [Sphingomonas sp. R-74633]
MGQTAILEPVAPPTSLHLVEEINHRVVNEYSEAIASLSLAANRAGSDIAKEALARAADRLRDHAESHRALLPPSSEAGANLADYIGRICNTFSQSTLAERGVLLALDAADIDLPADRCWRIGLVVAELIRNAARHGLRDRSGRIAVHVTEYAGRLMCLVRDTGQPRANSTPGRGQRLIRSLVADLGGSVEWSFAPDGASALVQLPLPSVARLIEPVMPLDTMVMGEKL